MPPPLLPRLLFRLGRHGGRREELTNDLSDLFERRCTARGARYARRRYWTDVLSFYLPRRGGRLADAAVSVPTPERGSTMAAFMFDVRQVLRSARRQPGFFAVAALTLAVGFAAHLSAFSLVDRLLLSPPSGVAEADRVFRLHVDRADRDGGRFLWFQTPYLAYQDFRRDARPFSAMAAYRWTTTSTGNGEHARQLTIVYADEHYFPLLGASPRLGRVFTSGENQPPSASPVVVLSERYWRSAFGGDESALGQTMRIGATTFTIVGVMPRGFNGDTPDPVDAWAPLHSGAHELPSVWMTAPLYRSVSVLARLRDGVSKDTAAEEAAAAYRRAAHGTAAADDTARVVLSTLLPGHTQQGTLNPSGKIAVWIEGVALLVLLVAVANVINLQMSRAAQQRRELAVRVALGAGRARLLARTLLESVLISSVAATIGVVLAYASATTLQRLLMANAVAALNVPRFAAVAAITVVLVSLICAALASVQVRMDGVGDRLKTGRGGDGFSRERLRQGLLVAQLVMSAVLLVGAGLFLQSIHKLGQLQFGHDQDRVLVITAPLRSAGYPIPAIEAFYDRALRELATAPGVERVAAAQTTPFAPSQSADLRIPGRETLTFEGRGYPTFYTVTPDFFDTMGMKILRGRGFTTQDITGAAPVLVLEQALATFLWPDQDPIGKCLIVNTGNVCREIVGVSTNTRRFVGTADNALRYYVPMGQRVYTATPQALFVRTAGDPAALIPTVREALLTIDAQMPHIRIRTLQEMSEPEKRPWRLGSTLFVLFGLAALLVATSGVYALLSFMVSQRSREIGVRLALGARPVQAIRLILRQSVTWAAIGVVIGLAVALGAGTFVQPMLFETSPYDVRVFVAASVLLLVVALLASAAPALRASRVDPNVALRAE